MGRWSATCGIALHAELLGNELLRMGHELIVFAPTLKSASKHWHHKVIRRRDEEWVLRCYDELEPGSSDGGHVDGKKLLSLDYDIFILESYKQVPYEEINGLMPKIRKKARAVLVVHNGNDEGLNRLNLDLFDAIVVFDERYVKEVLNGRREKVHVIPYPCHPVVEGSWKKLDFAEDKIVFFSFGRQPAWEYGDYLAVLERLNRKYDLLYWIVRSDGGIPARKRWVLQWFERPSIEKLYGYLHSADAHLLPKGNTRNVVVSSTCYQCLGSLCPIVAPDVRYFETLPEEGGIGPIVKYRDREDLEEKLERLIEDEEYRRKVIQSARRYVEENSSERIAERFLALFEELRGRKVSARPSTLKI
ncbi:TPA: glycosyltransferase family 1 protein [Candidatus Bathyarchaeota archaeon]|nr:glycosyltransferase family 1 protein [Candidatus Bathyarchaeota archaeon]